MTSLAGTAPVVVVGAGPVGMVAAHLLGARGVPTVVVERERDVHALPRAVHLDDEALRTLQSLGLAEAIAPHVRPVPGMQLVTDPDHAFWHFRDSVAAGPNGWPLSNMFHQPSVDRVLRAELARYPHITLRLGETVRSIEVRADHALVGLEGDVLVAGAVLACDGARSTVRRLLGVPVRDRGFDQRWLVVDVRADGPLAERPPQQVCDPDRPATYVPIGGDRYRWEWLLHPGETEEDLEAAHPLPERVAPWLDGRRVSVERQAVYRFHAVRAERFRVGPVFLLGDAAHQMPPFLGQGLCAGIRDAANLAWKLALVRAGVAGDALLNTYEHERAAHVDLVTTLAMLVGLLVRARGPAAGALRGALHAAGRLPPRLRRRLEHVPTPGLRRGPLVLPGRALPGRRAAGLPLPQVPVQADRLLDDLLGLGFAVVGVDADPLAALGPAEREVWRRLDATVVGAADGTGALAPWFRRHRATVAVVRPDRYVFAVCDRTGLQHITAAVVGRVLGYPMRKSGVVPSES
jgi:3-(3-hydroxy-phenyl)propionate hydroxylase